MAKRIFTSIALLILIAVTSFPVYAAFPGELYDNDEFDFSVPEGLESRVKFWKKVYTQYSTQHAIIHDIDDLNVIYDVVYLGDKPLSSRQRRRKLRPYIRKYKKILRKLARQKDYNNLDYEEERIYNMVQGNFHRASRNIRVQLGQRDRFEEGLKQSGVYMKEIKRIFKEVGVPEELTVLPHVESSFQLKAYSSAGAAGIWQFTRGTGRRFMRVSYEIDERRDPIISAYAAARLLKYNYEQLESWPLAITAYNHGVNGMKRAKRKFGDDIVQIVENYRSRRFGFASKNFLCEFLAALEVTRHPRQYFPGIVMYDPIDTEELPLESFIDISTLEKYFGMHRREIAKYNPSLRRPVISGKRRIPKNFILKVPADRFSDPSELYASIPDNLKHRKQVRLRWYTVRWGDNLSTIARRLGTSVRKLKERNNIGRRNRIYRGQVLEIPGKGRARKSKAARVVHTTPDWSMVVIPKDLETIKYRVRRHDTLTRIARKYHVPVSVLAKMNRMDDPHALRRGQRILVPKPGTDFELKLAQALKAKNNGTKTAKLDVKVESAKAEKSTVTASTVETLDEGSKVSAKLAKYTDNISINKNRPAFRPIKIAARTQFDYPVGLIKVDYDETLSHIADWARVSVRELRRINHLRRRGSRISVNQSIKVPFRRVSAEEFEEKRQEYHKAIQEDFFSSYKVEKVVVHKLRRGETLWEISNSDEMIPLWLLGNYNPDKNFGSLSAGETIKIPILAENPS